MDGIAWMVSIFAVIMTLMVLVTIVLVITFVIMTILLIFRRLANKIGRMILYSGYDTYMEKYYAAIELRDYRSAVKFVKKNMKSCPYNHGYCSPTRTRFCPRCVHGIKLDVIDLDAEQNMEVI